MGWVVNATHQPLYARERDPVRIVQEAGWEPRPVWKGAEILTPPTGIWSPNRSAGSESLYAVLAYVFNGLYCNLELCVRWQA